MTSINLRKRAGETKRSPGIGAVWPESMVSPRANDHGEASTTYYSDSNESSDGTSEISALRRPTPDQRLNRAGSVTPPVDAAGTQIVKKALKLMSLDDEGRTVQKHPHNSPLFRFDSGSFLDKGLAAVEGVSRIMEGFAVSVDNVIVQAFEDWGVPPKASPSPLQARRMSNLGGNSNNPSRLQRSSNTAIKPKPSMPDWDDFDAPQSQNLEKDENAEDEQRTAPRRATSKGDAEHWRKRAQLLHRELQKVRAQQQEFQRLREEYDRLKSDLRSKSTSTTINKSSSEQNQEQAADKDESSSSQLPSGLSPGFEDPAGEDPLAAQQIMQQMQSLLDEKAKLMQENDRLLRENTGLQELLDFTMIHQANLIGDDELFASESSQEWGPADDEHSYPDEDDGAVAAEEEDEQVVDDANDEF